MIPKLALIFSILCIPAFIGVVYAHTVDSVGDYRLEIGWMNEPVVSGETNGIELYVSPLESGLSLEEQEFKDGVTGLEKTVKITLIYDTERVTLPLKSDHNVEGKYYALVDPTLGGYYQANIKGTIIDTPVSLSMHPPKVENKTFLEFPPTSDTFRIDHESFRDEIDGIKDSLERIENTGQSNEIAFVGVALGLAGIVIASVAISKKR